MFSLKINLLGDGFAQLLKNLQVLYFLSDRWCFNKSNICGASEKRLSFVVLSDIILTSVYVSEVRPVSRH